MSAPEKCPACGSMMQRHDGEACGYLRVLMSPEDVTDLLDTLPYSSIPATYDVAAVVRWFVNHGWSPRR